ncbi:MAG TPA: hypothetical protein PKE69_02030 [Pyrinomonadaceae bacterium]|nr:hypothetical protein [Pyrinomonadaceae bacterium]
MKILIYVFTICLIYKGVWAQEINNSTPVSKEFHSFGKLNRSENEKLKLINTKSVSETFTKPQTDLFEKEFKAELDINNLRKEIKSERKSNFSQKQTGEKFHWKPFLAQTGIFLGLQHSFRLFQKKTRDELGGKFFKDWGKSVTNLRGWNDGDNAFTNYIAHPIQGSITGRIFIQNSERAKNVEFGISKIYWESRAKAFVWSTIYSIQFEMGPISEATIGNVGMRKKNGYSTMAWVDLVVTPTVGTVWLIIEDFFEKYVLKNWLEKKVKNKTVIKFFRVLFAPTTSFGSILQGKYPWWREYRSM